MKRFALLIGVVAVALFLFSASTSAEEPLGVAYDAMGPCDGLLTFVNAGGRYVEVLDQDFCVVFADKLPSDLFQVMVPNHPLPGEVSVIHVWTGGPILLSASADNTDFIWE